MIPKDLKRPLGQEAAAVIAHVLERADEKWRQELATKADLRMEMQSVRDELAHMATKAELAAMENRIIKWMMGGFVALGAFLLAAMALMCNGL